MWARFIEAALGIWLMVAPSLLAYGAPARTNDRIVGPVIASLAIIAIWEVTRPLRWSTAVLGLWLLVAPFLLGYETTPLVNSLATAAPLVALGVFVKGKRTQRTGGGWRAIWSASAERR